MTNCLPDFHVEENLLASLLAWCRDQAGCREAAPDTMFRRMKTDWIRRFWLRDALLPWVREETGLSAFYPDEVDESSTPRTLARHLAARMRAGGDLPVRPPAVPYREGRIKEATVFVLTCGRSGSTLFRCMLMGHPLLYAPPELHLAQYRSLRARERLFTENGQYWQVMGVVQTLAHLNGWSKWQAFHYMSRLTRRDVPVAEVYRLIHQLCPKPILVDKTPAVTLDLRHMERIEQTFENPRYLFLTRHPYAVIESCMSKQINPPFPRYSFDEAENRWLEGNRNVMRFLGTIPAGRWHRLSFEGLMSCTERTLRGVTDFLGIPYHQPMADAYDGERMQGGIGCINLPTRPHVVKELGERWRHVRLPSPLRSETETMAGELGYELPLTEYPRRSSASG